MRLAVLVAALLLFSGASALAASSPAPLFPQTWHLVKLQRIHTRSAQMRACAMHAKVTRWLAPVACEQPPRSELLLPVLLGG